MGKEIAVLCDLCGIDCTTDNFRVDISHYFVGVDGTLSVKSLQKGGDSLYLCRHCFNMHLGKFVYAASSLGAEWEEESEPEL